MKLDILIFMDTHTHHIYVCLRILILQVFAFVSAFELLETPGEVKALVNHWSSPKQAAECGDESSDYLKTRFLKEDVIYRKVFRKQNPTKKGPCMVIIHNEYGDTEDWP